MQLEERLTYFAKHLNIWLARTLDKMGRKCLYEDGELNWGFILSFGSFLILVMTYVLRRNGMV